jgi:phosphoglycerate dehydrogenase-like enzyme
MPKLLILSTEADEFRRLIEGAALPRLEIFTASEAKAALATGADCEILYGEAWLMRDVISQMPNLQWAQSMSAGVERLLAPELRRDYILTNSRGVFGQMMCEYVIAYLLAHERKIFERHRSQQARHWDRSEIGRLRGKTMGVLGVGSIGCEVARTSKHFGMAVRGYTRSSESCPHVDVYYHGDALLEFAAGCDYLVSVLPNTPETHHIVDSAFLEALPEQVLVMNIGRGSALDQTALIRALETKQIAAAVLDVFEKEPLSEDHPFWNTPNLLMTFHTSAMSEPADLAPVFIENYKRFVTGEKLNYIVDFELGY